MKPYPKYKSSGVPWLGDVPEHWCVEKLKHKVRFVGGGTPSKEQDEYWRGSIPWVSPKDMKSWRIKQTEDCISEKALAESACALIDKGAVLIVVRSGILQHSIPVALNDIPVAVNQDMKALLPIGEVSPAFIAYYIAGNQKALLDEWVKHGSTVESIEFERMAGTPLVVPAPSEQQAIATYLDTETARIDTLVSEKENLIDLLREYRQSVITEAVTKGMNPDAPMKESSVPWLGDFPAHWQVLSLRRALEGLAVNGVFKKGEDFGEGAPLVNVTDLFQENFVVDTEKLERVRCDESETQKYRVNEGDLFLVRSSLKLEGIARFAIVQAIKEETVFECHVVRMRPDAQKSVPMFLAYYLNSTFARQSLVSRAKTTTMTTIDQSEALATPLLLPPPSEQTAIAAYLDTQTVKIDGLISHVEKEIELLKELRSATITDAVLGRIDLRGHLKKGKQGDKASELQPAL
ncbi:MAG: restriction endonuclease subunit S [Rhizobium sp.]|nr:restriction endonuclease subunit S [Rhizobium sp.]